MIAPVRRTTQSQEEQMHLRPLGLVLEQTPIEGRLRPVRAPPLDAVLRPHALPSSRCGVARARLAFLDPLLQHRVLTDLTGACGNVRVSMSSSAPEEGCTHLFP